MSVAKTDFNLHNSHSCRIAKVHDGGKMFYRKFFSTYLVPALFAAVVAAAISGCGGKSNPLSIAVTSSASTVDGADSTTLTASVSNDKNAAGVSWSVSGGGTLSNTTTTAATYTAPAATASSQSVTITATSIADTSKTGTATITVPATPAVTSTSTSLTGTVGTAYSITLQASGGISPYTWALGTGTTLPSCLALKSTGTLTTASGTAPTASCAGTYNNITFKITDSGTPTALTTTSAAMTITITAPSITFSPALPAGTVGTAYVGSVAATGAAGATTYSLASGALPPDLSLNTSTGAITGTPKAADAGTATFKISVADAYGDTATSATLSIVIGAPTITFPSSLASGTVGTAYNASAAATGVLGATTYSVASGALPPDLSLNAGTGAITGTPKVADVGTATFKISALDAYGDTATSGTLSITIAAAQAITFGSAPAATATFGVAYSSSASATGGAGTLTYSLASGALPPDLTLAGTGAIAGTPKTADIGTFTFSVKATDAYGDSATSPTYSVVVIYPEVNVVPGPGSLPYAVTGQSYSQTLTASGGSGAGFTWAVTGLPANGISATPNGATLTISGPATAAGPVNFTATATDNANNSDGPLNYSIQVYSPVVIPSAIPASLPASATVNVGYTGAVVATGGSGNYSWTVTGLSDGLISSPSGATLTISGTPTSAATVTANVSVKDTTTNVTSGPFAYAITVYANVTLPATNPATLGPALESTPYTGTILAAGGSGNYTWTVTGLPSDNLNYSTNGATLTISGTPGSTPTTVSFTAKVTDTTTNLSSGPINYSVAVYAPVTLDASTLPTTANATVPYTGTITASGGSGSGYSWTVSGLSDGLTYSASGATLTISGTPTSAATVTVTASVKDSAGNSAGPANYTITVYGALTLPTPNPSTLGPAVVNTAYLGTVVASGGSGNYSWTVTGLPSNNLNYSATGGTLTISGIPGSATSVPFNVTLKDTTTNISVGPTAYSVVVYNGLTLPSPNPSTLPSGTVNQPYTGTIVAIGGVGPNYTWTVNGLGISQAGLSVTLSDGLSATTTDNNTLTITGTPTAANTGGSPIPVSVSVSDSGGHSAGPIGYTITVNGPLSLPTPDPSSLPANGYTNASYTGYINATGGSGNYSWSVSGLPSDGLDVTGGTTGSTLTISGTPTLPASGGSQVTVTFNVTLTDTANNAHVTQNNYNVNINYPIAVSLPATNPSSLPSATITQSYGGAINASGGVGPYSWSINGTAVPSNGLGLGNGTLTAYTTSGSTLSINGIPNATGTVPLTNVKVTDNLNTTDTKSYSITVSPVSTLEMTVNNVPQGMVNMPYTFGDLNISGGNGPYTVSYTNAPAGLSQQTGTWSLVGTPTSSGSTTVTVKVTDSTTPVAQQQTTTFTLPVVPLTVAAKNSELSGQYACYLEEFWDGGVTGGSGNPLYRGGIVFAFAANGSGNITGGEIDANSPFSGYKSESTIGAVGGTYVVGVDNRGYLLLGAGGGSTVLALAGGNLDSSSHFSELAIVIMDDAGTSPGGQHGSGHCFKQSTTPSLNGIQPSGGYVFALRGEDMQGNLEAIVGSLQYTGGSVAGVQDMSETGTYTPQMSFGGTNTTLDAYGRMTITAGPAGQNPNTTVMYVTNNSAGNAFVMSANPHNAQNNADFMIGEARAQNAAHVAAAHPFNGPSVLYESGLDSDLTTYDSFVGQISGSSSATSVTVNAVVENNGGTVKTQSPGTMGYATSTPSGRTTLTGQSGIAFYIYDTNSAAVLFSDPGKGAGSTTENQIGWLEPQTAPTTGTWSAGSLAASYFMRPVSNGDYNKDFGSGAFTLNSSGAFTTFAQDDGGWNWADWDEPLSGSVAISATGVFVPDTTIDPNGTFGIFDINMTQGGTTSTQVYCVAISVDKATNASTQGRFACIDAGSKSPQLTIISESD